MPAPGRQGGGPPQGPSLNALALQEELDVREQINKKLKEALEEKARETDEQRTFFLEMETLLSRFVSSSSSPSHQQEEDKKSLTGTVSAAIRKLLAALDHAQEQLQQASECMQQLQQEKQQTEEQLARTRLSLHAAERECLRLQQLDKQRETLALQAQAQQRTLKQQALLIDGLKQRCSTLEAERRELTAAQSTSAGGSTSSFRSMLASWGGGEQTPRYRGPATAETEADDVLAYTLAEGLEDGLRRRRPPERRWCCCCRRRRYGGFTSCTIQ